MSPTTRTRKPTVRAHQRSEIVTAVLVGAGIALVVLLLIWLLRPADPAVSGSGGLFTRQPRATLLVFLGAGALAWALWWVRRGHRRPKRLDNRRGMVIVTVVVIILVVLAGIFWPGGLVRHWPKHVKPVTETTSSTVVPTTTPGTTTKGSTTNGSTSPTTVAATTTPITGGK
jgi:cytochrome bd-type quinol oxidase subunit 2